MPKSFSRAERKFLARVAHLYGGRLTKRQSGRAVSLRRTGYPAWDAAKILMIARAF